MDNSDNIPCLAWLIMVMAIDIVAELVAYMVEGKIIRHTLG